ncbi:hypothetical protein QFZ54_002495 [Sphingomonas faeni]|nr:hypothetical protein [Sphingomonas faeni]
MSATQILPGTGRGTATRSGVVEGVLHTARRPFDEDLNASGRLRHAPSTSFAGPPPRVRGGF